MYSPLETSSLQATLTKFGDVPDHTERVVSYALPSVDKITDCVVVRLSDHHTVLVSGFWLPTTQGGTGSVRDCVAAELSTGLVKGKDVIGIAFPIRSFNGAVLVTVNGSDAEDSPALAASSVTETMSGAPGVRVVVPVP